MTKRREIKVSSKVYEKLATRAQILGLDVEKYVDGLITDLDTTPPSVSTVIVEVELAKGFYEAIKQYIAKNKWLAYESMSDFLNEAARRYFEKTVTMQVAL